MRKGGPRAAKPCFFLMVLLKVQSIHPELGGVPFISTSVETLRRVLPVRSEFFSGGIFLFPLRALFTQEYS